MSAKGFENMNLCGFVTIVLNCSFALSSTELVFPDAFSIMLRSIRHMTVPSHQLPLSHRQLTAGRTHEEQ